MGGILDVGFQCTTVWLKEVIDKLGDSLRGAIVTADDGTACHWAGGLVDLG